MGQNPVLRIMLVCFVEQNPVLRIMLVCFVQQNPVLEDSCWFVFFGFFVENDLCFLDKTSPTLPTNEGGAVELH